MQPKIRHKRRDMGGFVFALFGELDKEVFKPQVQGVCIYPLEFIMGKGPVEISALHGKGRIVLGHETHRQRGTKLKKEGREDSKRILDFAGKDEVSYQDAPSGNPVAVFADIEKPLLPHHFNEGLQGNPWVVRGFGKATGKASVAILEVREIDVDIGGPGSEHALRLITGQVVDDRQGIALLPKRGNQLKDMWEKMVRGYHVDIMDPIGFDHVLGLFSQFIEVHGLSQTLA